MTVTTFDALAADIARCPPRLGEVRLVTVDGRSGSGKSVFARRLGAALSRVGTVSLVAIEALYEGWTLDGAWTRLEAAVLEPIAAGWPGGFHPFDWTTQGWSPRWCPVPITEVLLIEGCGSSPRAADPITSCRIWIEAPPDVAYARAVSREGHDLPDRLREWQLMEATYFADQDTRARADLRVDGDPAPASPYDPDLAFTVLA